MSFMGYPRADGRVGVRNHVVVMSSVSCANAVVEQIGRAVPEVKTVTHTEGCGRGPRDVSMTLRTLANLAAHPNVAGYERMAETWFRGLQPIMPKPEPKP